MTFVVFLFKSDGFVNGRYLHPSMNFFCIDPVIFTYALSQAPHNSSDIVYSLFGPVERVPNEQFHKYQKN